MPVTLWILLTICVLFIWHLISLLRALRKRNRLINCLHASGDQGLALDEFNYVSYNQHYWACWLLRRPKKLYGPLIQGIWTADPPMPGPRAYDEHWWDCYRQVYLPIPPQYRWPIHRELTKMSGPAHLGYVMREMGYDMSALDYQQDQKFFLNGAEEYEEAIRAQELML
jgi:hypothetical protein